MIHCDRCMKPVIGFTMSRFNTQEICEICEKEEKAHPQYPDAKAIEQAEVDKKNLNYPGIGLPADLRQKMFDAIIKSEKHDELFRDAIWGWHDGMIAVDTSNMGDCLLCKEPLKQTAVIVSDVGEMRELCTKCGKIFILHAKTVILDWVKDQIEERLKEVDKAMAEEDLASKKHQP